MTKLGRRARQRKNLHLILGTLLLTVVLVALVAIGAYVSTKKPGLDTATHCPADGPTGHYVLLVDKTDPLTFTQKEAFKVLLRDLVEKRTPQGYLLSVFVLGEDFKESAKPLVELCNPGTGSDKSELTANLKKLRRTYEEQFLAPMLDQTGDLLAQQSAKSSPIFEMLQIIAINGFRTHDVRGERRLFLVSDMLHNTPQFNMYRGTLDFKSYSSSDYGRKTQLSLEGVDVELRYLINTPQLQTKRNQLFWEEFFNKAGARVVAAQPLEG